MSYEIGKWEARPLQYQFGASKNKGTEMVSVSFQFVGGPNDGKRMSWNGFLTEKTAVRTMEALEHCGWDGVDFSTPLKGFGSKNVEVLDVQTEKGQDGNDYPVIAWVNKLFSRGPGVVYDETQVKSLSERMAAINAERKRAKDEEAPADPFGNG